MQLDFKFEADNNKKYKVDSIWDSAVYTKESADQLLGLYYLIWWKSYSEEKNIWEPALAIQHFWRLVTTYHKDNPEKLIATSASVNMAPPMARPTTPLMARPTTTPTKKHSQLSKTITINK